jgi:hypothetical protein
MSTLKLDAFIEASRTVEWKGKKYKVLPISLRDRMSLKDDDDAAVHLIEKYVPDFPKKDVDDLTPLALMAFVKFILQIEDADGKN